MSTARLAEVTLPDFGMPEEPPELPASLYAARMERLRERLFAGMAVRGVTGEVAEEIFVKMKAFANYGFPESHSVSFAYLVYASSWIKYHEPAAFCAALINAHPMGFWAPHTLVQDARRHGVAVRTPDLNASLAAATLEDGGASVRLGLESVRGIGKELAKEIEAARVATGPYVSPRAFADSQRPFAWMRSRIPPSEFSRPHGFRSSVTGIVPYGTSPSRILSAPITPA